MKACSKLKKNNGMGCDWIHNRMVIEGKEILIPKLTIIFNKILNDGIHPTLWKCSEYVGMGKPKKDASDVNNLRALQLTSVLDRIFQKVLASRFITYFELNGFWDAGTSAYLVNRSIEDVILALDEDMWQILANSGVLNVLLFDFKSAFDTAWIDGFLFKMKYLYGIHGKIYKWLVSFLKGRYNRVGYRNYKTEWVH